MKLYYSPGACSLSPHIVLHESGLPFTIAIAPTKTHKLADGTDYYTINPLGYVPLLELDDGTRPVSYTHLDVYKRQPIITQRRRMNHCHRFSRTTSRCSIAWECA